MDAGSAEPSSAVHPVVDAVDRVQDAEQALDVRMRESFGVNAIDFAVLRWIERVHRRGGSTRVGDVSAHFGVSSGSATEIVHRLTRADLVQRVQHPSDARVRELVPTPTAQRRMLDLLGGMRRDLEALLSGMSDAEQRRIVALLAAIGDIIGGAGTPGRA